MLPTTLPAPKELVSYFSTSVKKFSQEFKISAITLDILGISFIRKQDTLECFEICKSPFNVKYNVFDTNHFSSWANETFSLFLDDMLRKGDCMEFAFKITIKGIYDVGNGTEEVRIMAINGKTKEGYLTNEEWEDLLSKELQDALPENSQERKLAS